jgi:hypothetical protein
MRYTWYRNQLICNRCVSRNLPMLPTPDKIFRPVSRQVLKLARKNGHHSCLTLVLQSLGEYGNWKSAKILNKKTFLQNKPRICSPLSSYMAEISAGPAILKFTLGRLSLALWLEAEGNSSDLHVIVLQKPEMRNLCRNTVKLKGQC